MAESRSGTKKTVLNSLRGIETITVTPSGRALPGNLFGKDRRNTEFTAQP